MPEFDFSTLITDRSASDLELLRDLLSTPMSDWTAEQLAAFNQAISKGAYNYTDLNRVTACMDYLNERLTGLGYVTGYHPIIVHPETPPEPVGPLPEGYTQLEYIESTGTQYIDTGFKPNQDTRLVCSVDFPAISASSGAWLFGSRTTNVVKTFGFLSYNSIYRSDYNDQTTPGEIAVIPGGKFTLDKNKNITYFDGVVVNSLPTGTFQGDYSLYLFANNNGGTLQNPCSAKLYSCQIYDNGALVRNFVPCQDPTGNVGLYDLVGAQFYGNAGSGTFTAGPEVPPPEPEPTLDPYTWYEADIPTESTMEAYLGNVSALRSVLTLPEDTAQVPGNMAGLTPTEANQIEEILTVIGAYLEAMVTVFRRCGAAICGGPGFYFLN